MDLNGDDVFYEKSLDGQIKNGDIIFSYPKIQTKDTSIKVSGAVKFDSFFPYSVYKSMSDIFYDTKYLDQNAYKFVATVNRKFIKK